MHGRGADLGLAGGLGLRRLAVPGPDLAGVAFFAVARFLAYIDQRIRLEGWEVELRLRAVGRGDGGGPAMVSALAWRPARPGRDRPAARGRPGPTTRPAPVGSALGKGSFPWYDAPKDAVRPIGVPADREPSSSSSPTSASTSGGLAVGWAGRLHRHRRLRAGPGGPDRRSWSGSGGSTSRSAEAEVAERPEGAGRAGAGRGAAGGAPPRVRLVRPLGRGDPPPRPGRPGRRDRLPVRPPVAHALPARPGPARPGPDRPAAPPVGRRRRVPGPGRADAPAVRGGLLRPPRPRRPTSSPPSGPRAEAFERRVAAGVAA